MDEQLISALNAIPVADLDRADWLAVGMALKEEGYPVSVWDEWSRNDKRYHSGECSRLWKGFKGSGNPVKAGTIVQMAKARGWMPFDGNGVLDWDSPIEYDGISEQPAPAWKPTADLITYLELLFRPDEYVAYVTNDVYQTEDGKWVPSKGVYTRTAGELIASLRKHPDDIGWTIGDWKPEAGAWIRFNAFDGEGVKNENVTTYRYALVESDTLSIQEQDELYRKYELPIAALVYSGGKSLHAIVRVDASNEDEYYNRV
ncbi:MAG: PriCT-2 domain-containing protein, partial [Oscillospiraceae bacterium]|nr:PriCT-2 domain-containing protein [Oscillospiraceae bacterium]